MRKPLAVKCPFCNNNHTYEEALSKDDNTYCPTTHKKIIWTASFSPRKGASNFHWDPPIISDIELSRKQFIL